MVKVSALAVLGVAVMVVGCSSGSSKQPDAQEDFVGGIRFTGNADEAEKAGFGNCSVDEAHLRCAGSRPQTFFGIPVSEASLVLYNSDKAKDVRHADRKNDLLFIDQQFKLDATYCPTRGSLTIPSNGCVGGPNMEESLVKSLQDDGWVEVAGTRLREASTPSLYDSTPATPALTQRNWYHPGRNAKVEVRSDGWATVSYVDPAEASRALADAKAKMSGAKS